LSFERLSVSSAIFIARFTPKQKPE